MRFRLFSAALLLASAVGRGDARGNVPPAPADARIRSFEAAGIETIFEATPDASRLDVPTSEPRRHAASSHRFGYLLDCSERGLP